MNLPDIESLEKVTFNPGDVIVANVKGDPSPEETRTVWEILQTRFPEQTILVLTEAITIEVMSRAQARDAQAAVDKHYSDTIDGPR